MSSMNVNSVGKVTLHNFPFYQLSDTTTAIDVSFPSVGRTEAIAQFLYKLSGLVRPDTLRYVFGTKTVSGSCLETAELACRLMSGSQRALRLVTLRTPKAHRPHDHVPDYILIYVVETLECGHTMTVYPQADPLIAKRRICQACQQSIKSDSPPPKKPVVSVRVNLQSELAA